MADNWLRLYRGVPPGGDVAVSEGTCWTPDRYAALSFAFHHDTKEGGTFQRAALVPRGVRIEAVQGLTNPDAPHDVEPIWAADDPAFRARQAEAGVDIVTYDDVDTNISFDCFGRVRGYFVGRGWNRVHLGGMTCYRVCTDRGAAALRVTAAYPVPEVCRLWRDRPYNEASARLDEYVRTHAREEDERRWKIFERRIARERASNDRPNAGHDAI